MFCLVASPEWTASAQQAAATKVLQLASEIRDLTPEQAAKKLPVRLRGVVTFWDNGLYSRFVQDTTAGIYIQDMTNMPDVVRGQMVAVEGFTSPGEYAPVIVPTRISVAGDGQFPAAKPVTAVELEASKPTPRAGPAVGHIAQCPECGKSLTRNAEGEWRACPNCA